MPRGIYKRTPDMMFEKYPGNKGKKISQESINKRRETLKKNGIKISQETRKKMNNRIGAYKSLDYVGDLFY